MRKGWLEHSVSHQKEKGGREGAGPCRETGCGGQRPKVEASGVYEREKWC